LHWIILSPTEDAPIHNRRSLGLYIESWEHPIDSRFDIVATKAGNDRIGEVHHGLDSASNLTSHQAGSEIAMLLVILCLICGLFSGAFTIALLFRRIAIALALTGPLMFSAIWIWWDWSKFRNKQLALGAFAVSFTLTFLALDREP